MRQASTITTLAFTGCLLGGCVVKLPGNLDAGEEAGTDEGDSDPTDDDPSDDGPSTDDGDSDSAGETDTADDGDPMGDGDGDDPPPIDGDGCQEAVDILVVVDNSGSMGLLQRRLANSMSALIDILDADHVDWRLGITTTDLGNPWCSPELTTPEIGRLQLRGCNEYLDDFVFADSDLGEPGCTDFCPYPAGTIQTTATTTDYDPIPSPRPWMERIDGATNLPAGVDPIHAALCLVPQGVNGCGFEQPLEAMIRAIDRSMSLDQPEYGFLRPDASLLVILVSDEVDCSHADKAIFDVEGNKAFWSDPTAAFPTSALCWNAGVSCSGGSPVYDDCVAEDYDLDGSPTQGGLAVLHPTSRYIETLKLIEDQKRAVDPGADVGVLVISGVGLDGELHYADVNQSDPVFQDTFGIGPGCAAMDPLSGDPLQAIPPVRMREVGAALSSEPLASICASNYLDPLFAARDRLVGSCE